MLRASGLKKKKEEGYFFFDAVKMKWKTNTVEFLDSKDAKF